jgi:hypothetical protein
MSQQPYIDPEEVLIACARVVDKADTVTIGGFGTKPVHVPVKIPPKKKPVRPSEHFEYEAGSLGDVISEHANCVAT